MRALRIVEPGRAEVVDVPDTSEPGPGEVSLQVGVIGLCGTDLGTFRGKNALVRYPVIPGHEVSGTIEAVGPGVEAPLVPGAPVYVVPYKSCGACPSCRQGRFNACRHNQTLGVQRAGAAQDRIVLPAETVAARPGLSLSDLALVEPLTIGFHAVDRARVDAADTVLVFGCGVVGLGAMAAASRRGARVIAVDVDDRKLAVARRLGAQAAVNSRTEDLRGALRDLTRGDGPGVVIEAVGSPATFRAAVDEVAYGGRVVYLGFAAEEVAYETRQFVLKELDVMGSRNALRADFRPAAEMLADPAFPREVLVSHRVGLEQAPAALADWSDQPAAVTKVHVAVGRAG
jgi:threonine dehydrogenase-like Zn-dependent dehydrogenase